MHTNNKKSSSKPYVPSGLFNPPKCPNVPAAYNAQYLRDHIRKAHPPSLHIPNAILEESLGLVKESLPRKEDFKIEEPDAGTISPLELPPRLLNFGTASHGDSMLWRPYPELDLIELNRRLESIARIERLGRAGLLNEFFAVAIVRK